jgi:hypothetical protein
MKKDVKENVQFLLDRYPATRTCDLKLLAMYWSIYDGFENIIYYEDVYYGHVTKPESIRRARQKIQKENILLKT